MRVKRIATKARKTPKPEPTPEPSKPERFVAILTHLRDERARRLKDAAPFHIPDIHEAAIQALMWIPTSSKAEMDASIRFMRACDAAVGNRKGDALYGLGIDVVRAALRVLAEAWIDAHGYAAIDAAFRR